MAADLSAARNQGAARGMGAAGRPPIGRIDPAKRNAASIYCRLDGAAGTGTERDWHVIADLVCDAALP